MTRWIVLPPYLVRAAGFAFERLDALRCRGAAIASEALDVAAAAREVAGAAFDLAVSKHRYAQLPIFDDPVKRKEYSRHVKAARAFARQLTDAAIPTASLSAVQSVVPDSASLVETLHATHRRWRQAVEHYESAFASDLDATRAALRELYSADPRMQEAVFLESPEAFDRIGQLLANPGPRNARARQRERLAMMYAQRFCAKNDTNSICGPHGVAFVPDEETALDAMAEPEVVILDEEAHRATYFSHWAAQRLLDEALARAGTAAPVTLRLHPSARLESTTVAWCVMTHDATTTFTRRYSRATLPPETAQLLAAMHVPRTRDELAALAVELGIDATETLEFLDELESAGVVLKGPVLASGLFYPLRAVGEILETWPASEVRTWALAEVKALEAQVEQFARGSLATRVEVFRALAARFVEATGESASRGAGRHYADRSLLHEDCYATMRASLGRSRAVLEGSLQLVVSTLELAVALARERVREWFRARYGKDARVSALDVHRAFDEDRVLETPATTARATVLRDARERVRQVIDQAATRAGDGPICVSGAELRMALGDAAETRRPGYLSIDVLPRHRAGGPAELVLGEAHGFFWLPTCLLDVLPDDERARVVDDMRAAVAAMAGGLRTAECVFLHTQATDRRVPLATSDLQMLVPGDRPDAIDFSAMDLRLVGDEFEFLVADEEVIPLVAYTNYPFLNYTSRIAPLFDDFAERFFPDSLLPEALRERDLARLCIDDLVVRRQGWRRSALSVRTALASTGEADLFRRGQALQRDVGCESRVFVSVAGEPKPVLLDFQNIFLLESLANLVEQQADDAVVKFSEMLPAPDELVCRGADGLRTAELRMGVYRA